MEKIIYYFVPGLILAWSLSYILKKLLLRKTRISSGWISAIYWPTYIILAILLVGITIALSSTSFGIVIFTAGAISFAIGKIYLENNSGKSKKIKHEVEIFSNYISDNRQYFIQRLMEYGLSTEGAEKIFDEIKREGISSALVQIMVNDYLGSGFSESEAREKAGHLIVIIKFVMEMVTIRQGISNREVNELDEFRAKKGYGTPLNDHLRKVSLARIQLINRLKTLGIPDAIIGEIFQIIEIDGLGQLKQKIYPAFINQGVQRDEAKVQTALLCLDLMYLNSVIELSSAKFSSTQMNLSELF